MLVGAVAIGRRRAFPQLSPGKTLARREGDDAARRIDGSGPSGERLTEPVIAWRAVGLALELMPIKRPIGGTFGAGP